ncbi:MAG TPA: trypsin-like peptidase domain-containing protein [Vicinamibacterales bacterium]|nr:trypsin-like peptidase domain-containing protein [Vicinamibacterales bacterium]
MTRQTFGYVALTAVVSFLLGVVATGTRPGRPTEELPVRPGANAGTPITIASESSTAPGEGASGQTIDFAAVAARMNAAVVNVDAASRGTDPRGRTAPRWRRDLGDDPNAPHEGSGSGFIIDAAGFILTNYHVVEGADRITITLGDGRVFKAELVGIDPAIDVALLRIAVNGPIPVAPLGDSDTLRVGEWVCAIGNPLGYVHSVTVGVVSFLGRKLFDQSLDAFIQTDAAISFGNSGGPLINSRGQVVGMTTAISAQASNIGFAIPIAQVVAVLPQLRENGRVARGYIGVGLTDLTPALHRALGLDPERGALVQDVSPGTPADRAGLRPYDVIVGADHRPIRSDEDLIRYIAGRQPGSQAMLEVWRDGGARQVSVKLTERPLPQSTRSRNQVSQQVRPAAGQDMGPLGISVKDLDAATMVRQGIPSGLQGVLVVDVDSAGPARLARLRAGHVLLEINRHRVASVAEFQEVVSALPPGATVAVMIYDQLTDQRVIATINPDSRP